MPDPCEELGHDWQPLTDGCGRWCARCARTQRSRSPTFWPAADGFEVEDLHLPDVDFGVDRVEAPVPADLDSLNDGWHYPMSTDDRDRYCAIVDNLDRQCTAAQVDVVSRTDLRSTYEAQKLEHKEAIVAAVMRAIEDTRHEQSPRRRAELVLAATLDAVR